MAPKAAPYAPTEEHLRARIMEQIGHLSRGDVETAWAMETLARREQLEKFRSEDKARWREFVKWLEEGLRAEPPAQLIDLKVSGNTAEVRVKEASRDTRGEWRCLLIIERWLFEYGDWYVDEPRDAGVDLDPAQCGMDLRPFRPE